MLIIVITVIGQYLVLATSQSQAGFIVSTKHWQWHQQSAKTRSHKYFSTKSATKLCLGRWMAGQIFRC